MESLVLEQNTEVLYIPENVPIGSVLSTNPALTIFASDPFAFIEGVERATRHRISETLGAVPAEDLALLIYSRTPAQIGEWLQDLKPSLLRDVLEQAALLDSIPRTELLPRAEDLALLLRACLGVAPPPEQTEFALPVEPELVRLLPVTPQNLRLALESWDTAGHQPVPSIESAVREELPSAPIIEEEREFSPDSPDFWSGEALAAIDVEREPNFDPHIELDWDAVHDSESAVDLPEADLSYEPPAPPRIEAVAVEPDEDVRPLEIEALALSHTSSVSPTDTLIDLSYAEEPTPETEAAPIEAPIAPEVDWVVATPEPFEAVSPMPAPQPPPFRHLQKMAERFLRSQARSRELKLLAYLQQENPELATLLGEADYFRIEDQILAILAAAQERTKRES